jgi:hypothetical protein
MWNTGEVSSATSWSMSRNVDIARLTAGYIDSFISSAK